MKCVLWSIGMLLLRYIHSTPIENLIEIHKNSKNSISLMKNPKDINDFLRKDFILACLTYEEENFTQFYKM